MRLFRFRALFMIDRVMTKRILVKSECVDVAMSCFRRVPASALAILRVDGSSSSVGLHALFVKGIDTGQKGSIRAD